MNKLKFNYLKLITFKELLLWDVKRYFSKILQSKYQILKLSNLINEQTNVIKPKLEPEKEFKILGVNNKIGLFDAYLEFGKNIKQPYKLVKNGFLAYNPYRVNVGSVGLKTSEQKYNLISNAYVVLSCKENLLPEFLYKIFQTETFNKIIRDNTSGSVRQNLTFEHLSNIIIPVPDTNVQENLVYEYDLKLETAKKLEEKANNLESEIESYLLDELGIEIKKTEKLKGLQFLRFKDMEKWNVDYLLNKVNLELLEKCKYNVVRFEKIIEKSQYGISEKALNIKTGVPMLRMNNIYNSELKLDNLKYTNLKRDEFPNLFLNKFDLLFNRTNSKELVGKSAIFDLSGDFVFASYLIRIKIFFELANVYYVNYILNSKIGRFQINLISRQILGQANVNASELKNLLFPLPPIEVQNQIVNKISSLKSQAKELKKEAYEIRQQAKEIFEKEIFN